MAKALKRDAATAEAGYAAAVEAAELTRREAKHAARRRYNYIPGRHRQYFEDLQSADADYERSIAKAAAEWGIERR